MGLVDTRVDEKRILAKPYEAEGRREKHQSECFHADEASLVLWGCFVEDCGERTTELLANGSA